MQACQPIGQSTDQRGCRNPERFIQHLTGGNGQVVAEAGDVAGAPVGQGEEQRAECHQTSGEPPPAATQTPPHAGRQHELPEGQGQHCFGVAGDLINPVGRLAGEAQQQGHGSAPRNTRAMVSGVRTWENPQKGSSSERMAC